MSSLFSSNIVIAVIVGLIVVVGAWYMFFSGSGGNDELLATTVVSDESAVERGIVDTLLTLRAVTLSGTIFSDPAFGTLRDFGTQIIPEPIGRPNPFAPRGFDFAGSANEESAQPQMPQP